MKKFLNALLGFVMIFVLVGCGSKKVNWEEIELGDKMPKPPVLTGEISTNRKDLAIVDIEKISEKQYKDYVQTCIDAGYDRDLEYEDWDTVYGAFNEEGYSIRISYWDKKMSITLEKPLTDSMKEIEWPTSGLGAMLPKPKSTLGEISSNSSDSFSVTIGKMPIDDYNEYVKSCEGLGYTIDFDKDDNSYSAKNKDGYELDLQYLGADVIEISLDAPEKSSSGSTSSTPSSNTSSNSNTSSSSSSGIRSDFKKAMDSYEKFMNDYVAFMKKYKQSNGSDLSLLNDYADYMKKYSEMMETFDAWESKELNDAETKYYIEVQTRVNKKLLEVAN